MSFETDRAVVAAMRRVGEPDAVIEGFLLCLDLSEDEREELRRVARGEDVAGPSAATPLPAADIASGDVVEMNPLTAQPQRSKPRS